MKLAEKWVKHLVELPETGMGFQVVDIEFEDGTKLKNIIVNNASEIDAQNFPDSQIIKIKLSE